MKKELIMYTLKLLAIVGLVMFVSYLVNTARADYLPQDHEYSTYMQASMERVAYQMTRDAELMKRVDSLDNEAIQEEIDDIIELLSVVVDDE